MKKILGLALAAFMVMGLVGGGTWAYFSDPESSTGNVFAAGTLDLEVDSANPWASAYVNITNLAPGTASTNTTITLQNVGNMIGDLYLRVVNVVDGAGAVVFTSDGEDASSEAEWTFGGGVVGVGGYTELADMSENLTLTCQAEVDGGAMAAVTGIDSANISSAETTNWLKIYDAMGPSDTMDFTLYATLHQDADNHLQGDNTTFDIEFILMQEDQIPTP